MTNSVTVSAAVIGTVGTLLPVMGTVSPTVDTVQLQLDNQNTTLPIGPWYAALTANGTFNGFLLPVAAGTWFVWAYDPLTGAQAVSGAVVIATAGATGTIAVPIPTSIVASLLGSGAAGETPDELTIAGVASDNDTALVAQSGKVVLAQPFSAIWTWIQSHLPGYLLPQVTISTAGTVQLDNSAHNQRILLVTASGVSIAPLITSLGPGFVCDVINASGSMVALVGMSSNTGASSIAAGGIARILVVSGVSGTLSAYAKL